MLFARALFAFLVLPGVVAFLVPVLLSPEDGFSQWWGLLPLAGGTTLLLACVREFYVAGRGTLAPWAPPSSLVTSGVYRWTRNPMYVAVLLILSGWTVGFESSTLALYTLTMLVVFHLRILLHEEPWLARTFGDAWTNYRTRVRRWL